MKMEKLMTINDSCEIFGISRQSYYQNMIENQKELYTEEIIIQEIDEFRRIHKNKGGRKLYDRLQPFLKEMGVKMGRDCFFNLLRSNGLLVKRRKTRTVTTDSKHWYKKYQNLTKNIVLLKPNQLWVSDITYVKYGFYFAYLSLVTDAYSRKIVGFSIQNNLKATGPVEALKIAIKSSVSSQLEGMIHHSDRGVQYCCDEYVSCLKKAEIKISMTETSDPLDNAIAERVNGIIKNEYDLEKTGTFKLLKQRTIQAVFDYNNFRQHNSIDNLTPSEAHKMTGLINRRWKSYYKTTKIDVT